MDIWSILGIEKTSDVKEIKRAYAKAVKNAILKMTPKVLCR